MIETLVDFIREELSRAAFNRLVLGVSGGLDSAVVAFLGVRAIGKDDVIGVIMPYRTSNRDNMEDAAEIIKLTGISKKYIIDITPQVDVYFENYPEADEIRRGNKMARERMSVLYDISAREKALVIGTSNKSEILLGYGTIHGDLACALNPIGDLYKTQVRALAAALEIPQRIIAKPPSADLYAGQSDEGEFGFSYEDLDRLLYLLVEKKYPPEKCSEAGFSKELVAKVAALINKNRFKGRQPVIANISKISGRPDRRNLRD